MINADLIMNGAFWLGVFPGIDSPQLQYVYNVINIFLHNYES